MPSARTTHAQKENGTETGSRGLGSPGSETGATPKPAGAAGFRLGIFRMPQPRKNGDFVHMVS